MKRLSIKVVAELSGASVHTLRAWERRYQVVKPLRTPSGRRVYSLKQVDRLRLLCELVAQGHSIGNIASLTDGELENFNRPQARGEGVSLEIPLILSGLLKDLKTYKFELVHTRLVRAQASLDLKSFLFQVVLPLLRAVGVEVNEGRLSIAQEHIFSAMLRDCLGQILRTLSKPFNKNTKRFGFAAFEGDHHEFGCLLAAILCAHQGFDVHYFGGNLPAADLVTSAKGLGLDFVVLGVTKIESVQSKKMTEGCLKLLDSGLPKTCQLWMGGSLAKELNHFQLQRPLKILVDFFDFETALKSLAKQR